MSCPSVTTINRTECIGNSLDTINSNFTNLKIAACDNYNTITSLNANILALNTRITSLSSQVPGIAKAWVKFDGTRDTNGVPSTFATPRYIYNSYNIDNVLKVTTTDTPTTSAGDYRIYFKPNLFSTTNYAVIGTSNEAKNISYSWLQPYSYAKDFVSVRVHSPTYQGDVVDPAHVSVAIFG